jgi:riboflavin kinase / FMN adenylyltransferase
LSLSSPTLYALGNFDGLHLGHRHVLQVARQVATQHECALGVLTLTPHPREVFQPDGPPFRLSHPVLQDEQFAALGVDSVHRLSFDAALRQMSATTFLEEVLQQTLRARGVVCGADFRFGYRRLGDTALLHTAPFPVTVVPRFGEVPYSASAIRASLRAGRVEEATASLGQPWTVCGTVIHGAKQGRTLGVPTANIDWETFPYLHPRYGVYAVEMALPEAPTVWHPAVANLGKRPTTGGVRVLLEVHALRTHGDWYGREMRVRFWTFLRTEQKFADFLALKTQIAHDIAAAKTFFKM